MENTIIIDQLWSIPNITKKLNKPRQPSINTQENTNDFGLRWSLSFFPYDRKIENEEYTSFRLNLFSWPIDLFLEQTYITVELSLFYYTGVFMRRKTFYQRIHLNQCNDFQQVIFRYSTKSLRRQLRRNKYDNLKCDTLRISVVVYFGDVIPTEKLEDEYNLTIAQ